MTGAEHAVRWTTVAAVVLVAAIAAYISYWHAVTVVTVHGETGPRGHLYPVAIDGIIVAASMVLLDAARHRESPPPLAWLLLAAGIAVTLAANVAYGVRFGISGALWAAWPAAAFVGCCELLMMLIRASARRAADTDTAPEGAPEIRRPSADSGPEPVSALTDSEDVPAVSGLDLNGSGLHPAEAEPFAGELARGEVPTLRRIRTELHVGQPRAQEVQARLSALARTP